MSKSFREYENVERTLLNFLPSVSPDFTVIDLSKINSFAHYDAIMEYLGQRSIVEVKVRKTQYDAYPTAFLELGKLQRLLKIQKDFTKNSKDIEYGCFYYAFYPASKMLLMFDLNNCQYSITTRYAPKFTAGSNNEMVKKEFIELRIEDAIQIPLIIPEKRDKMPQTPPLF